jgi:hypothetical protein
VSEAFRGRALFAQGIMHPYFSVGPSRQRQGTRVLSRRASLSGISSRILPLVKQTLLRHRAGFEAQRASSVRKWVKAPQATRRSFPSLNDDPSLCATHYAAGGDSKLYQRRSVIATLRRPPPHQDLGRVGKAGSRFARDDKELGPQLRETITRRTAS